MLITIHTPERITILYGTIEAQKELAVACGTTLAVIEDGPFNWKTERLCKLNGVHYKATGEREVYGPSYPRNLGIMASTDERIIILDSEILPRTTPETLAKEIADHPDVMLTFRCDYKDERENVTPDGRIKNFGNKPCEIPGRYAHGSLLSFPRQMAIDVGLFSLAYEGAWGKEDDDFGFRIELGGFKTRWCPHIRVMHLHHPPPPKDKINPNHSVNGPLFMTNMKRYAATGIGFRHIVPKGDLTDLTWDYDPNET
jgi:hypothetical protein